MAVVVYDITSKQSFENVTSWIEQARNIRGEDVTIIIVGNKIDLAEKRQVGTEEGQALADKLNTLFTETSAKVGINVKQLFKDLAATLPGVATSAAGIADGGATPDNQRVESQKPQGFNLNVRVDQAKPSEPKKAVKCC